MIYGREKGKSRYRPFDGHGFTNNLSYALRFHPDEGDKVNQLINQLNHDNPQYEFEARRGKGSIYGDEPNDKNKPRTGSVTRTVGDATITADQSGNQIEISFRVDIPDELRVYLMDNDFRSDREGHWTNNYDDYNLEVAGIAADLLIRYQDEQERNRPETASMRQGGPCHIRETEEHRQVQTIRREGTWNGTSPLAILHEAQCDQHRGIVGAQQPLP